MGREIRTGKRGGGDSVAEEQGYMVLSFTPVVGKTARVNSPAGEENLKRGGLPLRL